MRKRPNILFIFPDQHRGDWLPFAPGDQEGGDQVPVRMNTLRRLMDRGMVFTNAYTASPLCAPSRACLALGEGYDSCGVFNNNQCCPLDRPSLFSLLRDAGYKVGGVGKMDLHKPIMYWGERRTTDQTQLLGFTDSFDNEGKWDAFWASGDHPGPYGRFLEDRHFLSVYWQDFIKRYFDPQTTDVTGLPDEVYADNWEAENAITLLSTYLGQNQPWFLMVNFSGPHDPWDITASMQKRWEKVEFPQPYGWEGGKEQINRIRQNYAAMLENIDFQMGRMIAAIEDAGKLSDTIVIYASDHGEMLGDRNLFYKSKPWEPSIHVPMVMAGPGISKGTCQELVQLHDLSATILAWAGEQFPAERDSKSLVELAGGKDTGPVREFVTSALYTDLREPGISGYEEDVSFCKRMGEPEPIEEFCRMVGARVREVPAEKKGRTVDWRLAMDSRFKLIQYMNTGRKELYDRMADPHEIVDAAKEHRDVGRKLSAFLPAYPALK